MTLSDAQLDALAALALGELDAPAALELESQMNASAEMRAAYRAMRGVLLVARTDDSVPPPAAVIRRAKAMVPTHQRSEAPRGILRSIAAVVFDSLTHPPLAGVRGSTASRHVLYQFEGGEIDLQIEAVAGPGGAERLITGQVSAVDVAMLPARIEILRLGEEEPGVAMDTDGSGLFRVGVRAGSCSIIVRLRPDTEVRIEKLELP